MPGPRVKVTEQGAGKAALDLHQLGVRASDVRPVGAKVERIFQRSERRRFDTRAGGAWPPLAASTLERKAQQGLDPRILRATGALFRSLAEGDSESIGERRRDQLVFGTKLPYARYAEGTERQPRRELIDLRPAERREIADTIGEHVTKGQP